MEKIISISKATFGEGKYDMYDGYEVVTTEQRIRFGIENQQSCCESWGYFITNDETADFIDAELLSVSITDTCLNSKKLEEIDAGEYTNTMFVNLETSAGLLQFVAYNSHNGFYGHDAVLISTQLNTIETL